jgi:hypothetical protein
MYFCIIKRILELNFESLRLFCAPRYEEMQRQRLGESSNAGGNNSPNNNNMKGVAGPGAGSRRNSDGNLLSENSNQSTLRFLVSEVIQKFRNSSRGLSGYDTMHFYCV